MENKRKPILIAGGGIGGLATALALARVGLPSVVLERRREWSEAGAGIQLSPNGVAALAHLGVKPHLSAQVGSPEAIVVREAASARVLQRLPLGGWIAERHGQPYWLAHRRDLQAALLAAISEVASIRCVMGFEAIRFEDDAAAGGIRLLARDGTSIAGPALIVADGLHSTLRKSFPGASQPVDSGWTAARTVVPASDLPPAANGVVTTTETGVWLARDAHIVHYPVRGGSEIALVVITRAPPNLSPADEWSIPVATGETETALSRIAPALAGALGGPRVWRRWRLVEGGWAASLAHGRAALLGDSGHPTLPFLAQGGSLALEDAIVVAGELGRARSEDDIAASLARYGALRRGRVRRAVAAARRNGRIFHLGGPAAFARNAVMRLTPGEKVLAGYDWLYGWRPTDAAG